MSTPTHGHHGPAGDRRPDKHDPGTMSEESWAVHGGNRGDAGTGAIRIPIVMANSYRLPHDPTTLDESDPDTRSVGSFFMNPIVASAIADDVAARALRDGVIKESREMPRFPAEVGNVKLAAGCLHRV